MPMEEWDWKLDRPKKCLNLGKRKTSSVFQYRQMLALYASDGEEEFEKEGEKVTVKIKCVDVSKPTEKEMLKKAKLVEAESGDRYINIL